MLRSNLSFFWGCQKSAIIAILKTSGSISYNSWLRCYRIVCYRGYYGSGIPYSLGMDWIEDV